MRKLAMKERIFGHIPAYPIGSLFESRIELSNAGVHRPTQAGISGTGKEGADSIVLSGGYEDDRDYGDTIIYTGHGGRHPDSGKQIENQELKRGNLALAISELNGYPVRVIRGANHLSNLSPKVGYKYDGLYQVDDHWREQGKSGFFVWRFRLVKIQGDEITPQLISEPKTTYSAPERKSTTILRVIRDTKQAQKIKALYDFRCQVCETRLETAIGPYAEAAHIRPLGEPHNGPDTADNILCLCPNHHVLFDKGAFSIADDFSLIGSTGQLNIADGHSISKDHLKYHREHYLNVLGNP